MKTGQITAFAGINNRLPKDRLDGQRGPAFVHDAVNVDIDPAGRFLRRRGYARVVEASHCRSLFGAANGLGYYAAGTELRSFDGESSIVVGTLASIAANVAYAETPLGLAWSDGVSLNLVVGNASQPVAPRLPNPMPTVSGGAGAGLPAGTYGVCFASRNAAGQRSPLSAARYVTVPEDGLITIDVAGHSTPIDYFVTAANGEVFYRAGTIAVNEVRTHVALPQANGEAIAFEVQAPLPAGSILACHKGRLISAVGSVLSLSLPFQYGVYRPGVDFLPLTGDATLVASVEGGLFVATAKGTWFLPGGDLRAANMAQVAPYGAVPGTLTEIPNSKDLMWFSPRGAVRAGQDGSIELLQDDKLAFEPSPFGAAFFREENGMRSFIAALSGSKPTGGAVVGSYMDAEVISI